MEGDAFCRIADGTTRLVVLFLRSRKEIEEALAEVLADEPDWQGDVAVVAVDFGHKVPTVEGVATGR